MALFEKSGVLFTFEIALKIKSRLGFALVLLCIAECNPRTCECGKRMQTANPTHHHHCYCGCGRRMN